MKQQDDTAIIVIHEIYGINAHIGKVCEELSQHGFNVFSPDLLERKAFDYTEESEAYGHFKKYIGFEKGAEAVLQWAKKLKEQYGQVLLLGFSVGATIAWMCSETGIIDGVIGYYGSRIRDYIHLQPVCPTMLFFPENEDSFHVQELAAVLEKKQDVATHLFPGEHGFSDPYSRRYHEESAEKAFQLATSFLKSR
ncbi:MAG TPA: dienelactone hydrolase family protein [Bacillaceae bacterium]